MSLFSYISLPFVISLTSHTPLSTPLWPKRHRIKEFELERARTRLRLNTLKEKVVDCEKEIAQLKTDNELLMKISDKYENQKVAVARKDNLLATQKQQITALQQEIDDLRQQELALRAEHEKKVR